MGHSGREENPFEDAGVAQEWINSVENERGMVRERELYPMLRRWAENLTPGTIVDIGAGQGGCSEYICNPGMLYVGIEPSVHLVTRAREKYHTGNRRFVVGNAYDLPLPDSTAEAAFSINVWFHLADLETASCELSRILKPKGQFLVCTANPHAYDVWLNMFENPNTDEKKIDGKVHTPVNPLSRNLFFKHRAKDILGAFARCGLCVQESLVNGQLPQHTKPLFVTYIGQKI